MGMEKGRSVGVTFAPDADRRGGQCKKEIRSDLVESERMTDTARDETSLEAK